MSNLTYNPADFTSNKVLKTAYIDSTAVVRCVLFELRSKFTNQWLGNSRIRSIQEADWLLSLLNNPYPYELDSLNATYRGQILQQQYTYIRSNLRSGFIFYFLCDGCDFKVKRLYLPENRYNHGYRCRNCHCLTY